MSIFTERTIKISADKATMSSDIHIYRGNRNIELLFTITDHQFKFTTTENSGNVIEVYSPSHGYVTLLTPLGTELCSGKAAITNNKLVFKITSDMIDENTEVGDYDIVIDLYDEASDALLTLPPVQKQIHILERVSLVNDPTIDPVMFNKDTSDLSVGDSAIYSAKEGNISLSQVATYDPKTDELIVGRPKDVSASDRIKSINGIPVADQEVRDLVDQVNATHTTQIEDISKDISGLASKDELHNHSNKAILDSITQDKINLWDNSGNAEDNSTIPQLSTICVKDESGNSLLTLDFDLIPKDKSTVYLNDVFTKVQGNGILKIRRDGVEHTFGVLSTDYMLVTIGYKTSTNTLLITNTRKAMEFDFNTNKSTLNELSSLNGKASISTVLTKTNSTEYTPTSDYHPSTKKYVDDKFKRISTFPLDGQIFWDAVDTGVLSDENNQLVVDWFNRINNDQNYFSCLLDGMISDIAEIGDTEIKMTKVMFDGVDLIAYIVIVNKSVEDKITITLNTPGFTLTPRLE